MQKRNLVPVTVLVKPGSSFLTKLNKLRGMVPLSTFVREKIFKPWEEKN